MSNTFDNLDLTRVSFRLLKDLRFCFFGGVGGGGFFFLIRILPLWCTRVQEGDSDFSFKVFFPLGAYLGLPLSHEVGGPM